MNLQEATEYIKTFLDQDIDPNTLRKACASGRLKAVRKGEGNMHVRRTEWDVKEEELVQFVQDKYNPRPIRRQKKETGTHIPKLIFETKSQNTNENNNLKEKTSGKVFYRVLEHLYQRPLPIHGDTLEKYGTRIVEEKNLSRAKAEEIAQNLRKAAQENNLADQLQYEVVDYVKPKMLDKVS